MDKNKTIAESELILNPNGSIYHLNLLPEQITDTIITVGDPDRVSLISKHFDSIEFQTQKREIKTHIGTINHKKLMVISTGMGSDNIDIVLNELDALVNIDFETRTLNKKHKSLNIIRIGTSGALQKDIAVNSNLLSTHGIGLDGLLHYYQSSKIRNTLIEEALKKQIHSPTFSARPYCVNASERLFNFFDSEDYCKGITITAGGFYGPQGRKLRIQLANELLLDSYRDFSYNEFKITNLEMETAALYGLSALLGHQALSINHILANRETKDFSKNTEKNMENLIVNILEKLISL